MKKLVIWDLDGTLVDTSRGIFNSVRYAERKLKLQPVSEEELRDWIGPKIIDSYLAHYNISREKAELATLAHREYGVNHAIYEAMVYQDIPEVMHELSDQGILQAVATMKPQEMAEKILEHFYLQKYLIEIIGMDSENQRTKSDNVQMILSKLGISRNDTILIGDTLHDLHGAKSSGIDFIPVSYGYGFNQDELVDFNGRKLNAVETPKLLKKMILTEEQT